MLVKRSKASRNGFLAAMPVACVMYLSPYARAQPTKKPMLFIEFHTSGSDSH